MSLIGLMLLISVQTSDIYLREAPAPNWSARSNAVQCGLLEAEVSHKSSRKAKRPDKLKGEVRYLKQKRDLSVEMDQIADQIESVYDLGISCPADNRVKITIIGNTSAGEKSFEIYINDRLEVEVYSYDGNRFEDR